MLEYMLLYASIQGEEGRYLCAKRLSASHPQKGKLIREKREINHLTLSFVKALLAIGKLMSCP